MEFKLAQPQDIDAWMDLVEQVRWAFPGLETAEALAAHRATVLDFMEHGSAICAAEAERIMGVLLFSKDPCSLSFLAVDPRCRRRHIAQRLVSNLLAQLDSGQELTLITYREGDPHGAAARAFYKHLGFAEGKLLEAFGHPVQEFVLRR